MNSLSDENEKRQRENFSTPESESNVLEASTVRCFPAVKRSFRQKQCNWRWRWKYFTRFVFLILSCLVCGQFLDIFSAWFAEQFYLNWRQSKANRWCFTSSDDILYGNELPGDSRGKHHIILCNTSYTNNKIRKDAFSLIFRLYFLILLRNISA